MASYSKFELSIEDKYEPLTRRTIAAKITIDWTVSNRLFVFGEYAKVLVLGGSSTRSINAIAPAPMSERRYFPFSVLENEFFHGFKMIC